MDTTDSAAGHVLVIEDEPKLAALLADYLAGSGYRVDIVDDGAAAVPAIRAMAPDVVLLDLMLPGRDGMEICRELRTFSDVPVIMVTARIEEIDRLLGLELGADDYVCKPFSPREVVARVRAQLRRARQDFRAGAAPESTVIEIRDDELRAAILGEPLDLTPVEFRLLRTLVAHPGRVFSRQKLMDAAYEDHRVVSDRTIDTHIKNLRRKLDAHEPTRDSIQSVYGAGYRYERTD